MSQIENNQLSCHVIRKLDVTAYLHVDGFGEEDIGGHGEAVAWLKPLQSDSARLKYIYIWVILFTKHCLDCEV